MATHKTKLNDKQVHLLKLIYKFRFVSAGLLAEHKGLSKQSINSSLKVLTERGFIARHYDKSYKLLCKPASYYLAPKAIKLLREDHQLNEQVLHARYKDKSLGQAFIDHSLSVFRAYLDIRNSHPDAFSILTKAELADHDYFLQPLPDLYLNRKEPEEDKSNDFMIDIFEAQVQTWIIKKRIDQYIEHFENGDWIDEIYPEVILLVQSPRTAKTLNNYIEKKKDENYLEDELQILAVTKIVELNY